MPKTQKMTLKTKIKIFNGKPKLMIFLMKLFLFLIMLNYF